MLTVVFAFSAIMKGMITKIIKGTYICVYICMHVCMGTVQRIYGPQNKIRQIRKNAEMNDMENIEYPVGIAKTFFSACIREEESPKISALSI